MGKNLLPLVAGAGLAALTGGGSLAATAAAEGGAAAGAAGAAAGAEGALAGAGALGAGDALAAQGAAGLLGTAGAEAAGYGSLLGAGGLPEIAAVADQAATPLTAEVGGQPMTAFGPNNEYWGQSITDGTGMTPNSFTGGFDSMNGAERFGQRLNGMFDGGGNSNLSKAFKFMNNGQQQPQQQRPAGGGAPRPMQVQQVEPMRSPYDSPMTQEEQIKRIMLGGY